MEVGIVGIHFHNAEQLRRDLSGLGVDVSMSEVQKHWKVTNFTNLQMDKHLSSHNSWQSSLSQKKTRTIWGILFDWLPDILEGNHHLKLFKACASRKSVHNAISCQFFVENEFVLFFSLRSSYRFMHLLCIYVNDSFCPYILSGMKEMNCLVILHCSLPFWWLLCSSQLGAATVV